MITFIILIKSFFDPNGYLTPDSTRYLMLAQSLLDGNGFDVNTYLVEGNDKDFFAMWPIGYPSLIFLVAKLTTLSVFWASKILNIIFIGLSLLLLRKLFKAHAHYYALIFLFGAYLDLYSFTWSEAAFVFGMLWLASGFYFFSQKSHSLLLLLNILAAVLFLFLMRYAGIFTLPAILLFSTWFFWQKDYRAARRLIYVFLFGAAFIGGYFYYNWLEVGHTRGVVTVPSFESHLDLLLGLVLTLATEFILFTSDLNKYFFLFQVTIMVLISFYIFRNRNRITFFEIKNPFAAENYHFVLILVVMGIVYYGVVIYSRWTISFDAFSYRLFSPGSFLFFVGIIALLLQHTSAQGQFLLKRFLVSVAIISVSVNLLSVALKNKIMNYDSTVSYVEEAYKSLEDSSLVVFADWHVNYLKTSLISVRPYYLPYYAEKETVQAFIERISSLYPQKNIYVKTDIALDPERYDASWFAFLDYHKSKEFCVLNRAVRSYAVKPSEYPECFTDMGAIAAKSNQLTYSQE